MKKELWMLIAAASMMGAVQAAACPEWECQLDINDYSCGGYHACTGTCTNAPVYDESTNYSQYIYCPYCGHEMWDCQCQNTYYDPGDCDGSYNCSDGSCSYADSSYNCPGGSYNYGGCSMSHWANVRDECGNIIGQIGEGSCVEVVGEDCDNPGRVLVYDPNTGTYGSVLSECVFGGYEWDGSGDNGCYNSYQGQDTYEPYQSCGDYQEYGCTDTYDQGCGYQACEYVRYIEAISIIRQFEARTGCGIRSCF